MYANYIHNKLALFHGFGGQLQVTCPFDRGNMHREEPNWGILKS